MTFRAGDVVGNLADGHRMVLCYVPQNVHFGFPQVEMIFHRSALCLTLIVVNIGLTLIVVKSFCWLFQAFFRDLRIPLQTADSDGGRCLRGLGFDLSAKELDGRFQPGLEFDLGFPVELFFC